MKRLVPLCCSRVSDDGTGSIGSRNLPSAHRFAKPMHFHNNNTTVNNNNNNNNAVL